MNADIAYNSRVANEASLHKAKALKHLNILAATLGMDLTKTPKAEPALTETNTWLAALANKLQLLDEGEV